MILCLACGGGVHGQLPQVRGELTATRSNYNSQADLGPTLLNLVNGLDLPVTTFIGHDASADHERLPVLSPVSYLP